MSNEIQISAESRTEFGKGAARRIRRDDKVPAVMYGHGTDAVHITLPGHAMLLALRTANALLSISIDGGKGQLALPKQVQRDPIRGFLSHVDLVIVTRGEKVTVEVPLVIEGDDWDDRIVTMDQNTITIEVEATHIPQSIVINVADLEVGDQITAADLKLPEGAVFPGEPDDLILSIAGAKSAAQLEADVAAPVGAAGAPAAAEASAEEA